MRREALFRSGGNLAAQTDAVVLIALRRANREVCESTGQQNAQDPQADRLRS
jgi:hypothetical protein